MTFKRIVLALAAAIVGVIAVLFGVAVAVDPNGYKGQLADAVESATGRKLTIEGPIAVSLGLSATVSVEKVSLGNAPTADRPNMATIRRIDAAIRLVPLLWGRVALGDIAIDGADISLSTDETGRGNWEFAGEPALGAGPAAVATFSRLTVSDSTVRYRGGATGAEYAVAIDTAVWTGGLDGDTELRGKGMWRERPFEIELASGPISNLFAAPAGAPWPIRAGIAAGGEKVEVSGRIAIAGARWALEDLDLKFGETRVGGLVTASLDGTPRITAKLDAPLIDLEPVLGRTAAPTRGGSAPPGPPARLFSDAKLPLGSLVAADVELEATIGTLRTGGVKVSEIAIEAKMSGGQLTVVVGHAGISGGHVSGTAAIAADGGRARVDIDLNAEGIDLGALLAHLRATDKLVLHVGGSVVAHGTGVSIHEVISHANGRMEIIGSKGEIKTDLIDLFGDDLLRQIAPWSEKSTGTTAINCVVARYDLKDGIAVGNGILLDTSNVTVAGKGTIDLAAERYDMQFVPKPKKASLLSLAVPVNMTGPLTDPSFRPDEAGVAKGVAAMVGTVVNPFVILVPLVSLGSGDRNPCVAALAAKAPAASQAPKSGTAPESEPAGAVGRAVKGVGDAIGRGIKGIFGR